MGALMHPYKTLLAFTAQGTTLSLMIAATDVSEEHDCSHAPMRSVSNKSVIKAVKTVSFFALWAVNKSVTVGGTVRGCG
eukprot:420885-Hanusia_phi.AAC.1